MPVLTREEGDSYLQYRPALAGYTGESLFKPSDSKMIHKKSNGLPGRMNEHANRWLEKKYAPNSQKEGIFTLLRNLPLKAVGWDCRNRRSGGVGALCFQSNGFDPPIRI